MALLAVYLAWGSTYLAIRIALDSMPPFFMMGTRFFLVGTGLYVYLRLRGAPNPTPAEWGWSAVVGTLLFLGGSAGVAYAQQWVASGVAAMMIATTPLWTVLFAGIWKRWPNKWEWAGLMVGLAGVVILNFDGNLTASPIGAFALIMAAASWSLGAAWSPHARLPHGMMTGAVEMITGGAVVLGVSLVTGEHISAPSWRSAGAIVYLAIFGSLVGFNAFTYLLRRVRPALAMSYAYVNPIIAVLLGVLVLSEQITLISMSAMAVILAGVGLVMLGQRK